jgi:hypothetical protein
MQGRSLAGISILLLFNESCTLLALVGRCPMGVYSLHGPKGKNIERQVVPGTVLVC